jgi:hypothetical protein
MLPFQGIDKIRNNSEIFSQAVAFFLKKRYDVIGFILFRQNH